VTGALARAAVEPNITNGLLAGDPAALNRFDAIIRRRVLRQGVVRVKLWTAGGRIIYSDERRLIGSRYALRKDDLQALDSGEVAAEQSDLTRPENRFERRYGNLLEVYTPVATPRGGRLLFEAYLLSTSVAADARRIWRGFIPVVVGALLLLWVAQIPLARSLARRLRRSQEDRERLLLRALDASNAERRRIAADLHDGIVQDLAGTSLAMSASADRADGATTDELVAALRDGARRTRQGMRGLRSLLVEIYPPNLHAAGLEAALRDLVEPLAARGIDAELECTAPADLPRDTEQAVFRTAQEALRNVVQHSGAAQAKVQLSAPDGVVRLVVSDDGRGFDPETVIHRQEQGQLGIALLADRAADLGGRLDIDSEPGRGTRVVLEVPR